ncbi:MAG: hypothetical protein AB4368_22095 [Xenococcaceae cyanobacterium]
MINLTKTTSRSSSGSTFRTYDIDGVKLGASPIEELIPLTISNLEQNFYKEFDLSKFCNCDLMAVIFRADFPIDDTETSVLNYRGGTLGADCIVRVLDQDRVIERIDLQISSYPTIQINPLVIDRRYTYQVTTSTSLNRLTFFCKPISLLEPINIFAPNLPNDALFSNPRGS